MKNQVILCVKAAEAVIVSGMMPNLVIRQNGILRRSFPRPSYAVRHEKSRIVPVRPAGIPLEIETASLDDALTLQSDVIPLALSADFRRDLSVGDGAGLRVQSVQQQPLRGIVEPDPNRAVIIAEQGRIVGFSYRMG